MLSHRIALATILALVAIAAISASARAISSTTIYLPLIATPPTAAQLARDRINAYRQLAGAPPLQLHPALALAAHNHARYDLLNYGDPSAWRLGPHGEVAGKPGFTGESSGARAIAAGYPWPAGWEVIDHLGDPTEGVDDLMNSVYHRVGILTWTHQYLGYGYGRSAVEAVDVIDFGRGPTEPVNATGILVFPSNGQIDIPLYGAAEAPDPLPPDGRYPIGYPITVQPAFGIHMTVDLAEIHDESGAPLAVYPNPPGCDTRGCVAPVPRLVSPSARPLKQWRRATCQRNRSV